MIILNFSHPITAEQITDIENSTNESVEKVIDVSVYFENEEPFIEQANKLLGQVSSLDTIAAQGLSVVVNLPSLNYIAALLLVELHKVLGYYPRIIRLYRIDDGFRSKFKVAEVINLQNVYDETEI